MATIRKQADAYIRNRQFFQELRDRERTGQITQEQRESLIKQALAGAETEAHKVLGRILEARYEN